MGEKSYNNDDALIQEAIDLFDKKDYENAVVLLKELAEEGFDDAQYYLGKCYEDGLGVEENHQIAFFWYFRSALKGNGDYQNNVGWCFNEGFGVPRSEKEAEHWYTLAAEAGNLKAQCNLGILYLSDSFKEKIKSGVSWLRKAARKKYGLAELNLGICYLEGTGTPRDFKRALDYFMLAGEHGEGDGYNNAAICYQNGYGVEIDEKKAFELFTRAAVADSPEGNINLGYCYEKGIGTEIDFTNALIYFEYAANLGDEIAMYKLGTMYENELYYGKDYSLALDWYQKSYHNGFETASEAYIHLSNKLQALENPDVTAKNERLFQTSCELYNEGKFRESFKGFNKLAEFNHAEAMVHIGRIFLHASTMKSCKNKEFNREQAFKWFYKAVNQANPEAFLELAQCFEEGIGTIPNHYRARYWAGKALDKGIGRAQEMINRLVD